MGTNYYCETGRTLEVECDCGFTHFMPETLHIGKSSWGWKFALHAIPAKGLLDWSDWLAVLEKSPRIFDEYGEECSLEEMKKEVLDRGRRDLSKDAIANMRSTAEKYGYALDEEKWLFSCRGERQGSDGDYYMLEGEFS